MNRAACLLLRATGFGLVLVLAGSASVRADDVPPGFQPLFNGKDLSGWHGWAIHAKGASPSDLAKLSAADRDKKVAEWTADAQKHWSVQNGDLVNDGHGAYLATDKEYGDIELLIDYKTVAKADSGIYLRATPQVQIWDTTKEGGKWDRHADKGSGGLFNNSKGAEGQLPLVHADKPFGEWNRFRIVQVGERTSVWLNGKLVVDHARMENFWNRKLPLAAKGAILLQTHGGEIRWKNIFVREIPAAEANALLAKKTGDDFKTVFDGQSFAGWDGPVANYQIENGAILCKPGKGGTIFTKEQYQDFQARLEYRLPAGGNNGLAIRYPGTGDSAYVGMCELQILDDTAEKYKKLDTRQFNGSAYGMAASHRGYLRPVGEWNFMLVTVQGSTIQVELNGTRILDTDLAQAKDFMAKSPHPGKDRTAGHFGFCGHGDAVSFRNIALRKLAQK
ncbi:MAG: DUF1080 domain-containing protein [Bacteroidales bacterium]|nr:DUF1080 domain-containing protein [Bacteroidales bacterium]